MQEYVTVTIDHGSSCGDVGNHEGSRENLIDCSI